MSLKWASGRFFLHFREIFEKCIEYIGKFLVHFREILNFCEKVVHFRQILPFISWSLPDDEGGITCMLLQETSLHRQFMLFSLFLFIIEFFTKPDIFNSHFIGSEAIIIKVVSKLF